MKKKETKESAGAGVPVVRGLTLDELDMLCNFERDDSVTEPRIYSWDSTSTFCQAITGDGRVIFLNRLTWTTSATQGSIADELWEVVGQSDELSDDLDKTRVQLLGPKRPILGQS